jgi:hypothetical protein
MKKITKRVGPPVRELTVRQAIALLRDGIPVTDLPRYRNTVMGLNESFWTHLKFLEGLRIARVEEGRLKQRM